MSPTFRCRAYQRSFPTVTNAKPIYTMGSKQRPFCHLSLTRLQLLLANKKLSFLVSILLASILYQTQAPHGLLSSSSNKRKGLGGGDASGELHSVLRRKQEGRAAVAIIRVTDDIDPSNASAEPQTKYLVQIKATTIPSRPFGDPYAYSEEMPTPMMGPR